VNHKSGCAVGFLSKEVWELNRKLPPPLLHCDKLRAPSGVIARGPHVCVPARARVCIKLVASGNRTAIACDGVGEKVVRVGCRATRRHAASIRVSAEGSYGKVQVYAPCAKNASFCAIGVELGSVHCEIRSTRSRSRLVQGPPRRRSTISYEVFARTTRMTSSVTEPRVDSRRSISDPLERDEVLDVGSQD
jgi:hypothetical protein